MSHQKYQMDQINLMDKENNNLEINISRFVEEIVYKQILSRKIERVLNYFKSDLNKNIFPNLANRNMQLSLVKQYKTKVITMDV